MRSLALTRWILAQAARSPLAWGGVLIALGAGWVLEQLVDLGVATSHQDLPALRLESALLAGILATGLAAARLVRIDAELCALGPVRRTWTELVPLVLVGGMGPLLLLAGSSAASGTPPTTTFLYAAVSQLHLAGLALLLVRSPLPAGALVVCLGAVVWPVASLLPEGAPWGRALLLLADPAPWLAAPAGTGETPAVSFSRVAVIAAMPCAAAALAAPYVRQNWAFRGVRTGGRTDG